MGNHFTLSFLWGRYVFLEQIAQEKHAQAGRMWRIKNMEEQEGK